MMRTSHAAIASSVVVLALVGCNSILDNQPGLLVASAEAGTPRAPSAGPAAPAPLEAGTTDEPPSKDDAGTTFDAGPLPCPIGQQRCAGSCVSSTDPLYGCGDPTCTPCPTSHSSTTCQGGKCAIAKCDPGYVDCNAKTSDGCESDLSKPTSCGACGTVCGAIAPLCAPSASTFKCTNGCPADAPVKCGAECADPLTSTNHCGGCDNACANVANAISACTGGVCTVTCKPTFHSCGAKCAADNDAAACGAACIVCSIPAGGSALCVNGACRAACPAATHLCGGSCVADADATACGAGCIACPSPVGGAALCSAGACQTTCPAATHLCAGKCVADNDATACGAACNVCPTPPGGAASCVAGACGITCTAGFANCDANALNGCEAVLASDPLHCGSCAVACAAGQACMAGMCL